MDPFGYCGEQKVATFTGTGSSVRAEVEGEETTAIITRNTNQPLHHGEFTFNKVTSTVVRDYLVDFSVNVHYNMTPQVSGKELTFTAGDGDPVTGQTTLNSGTCNFTIRWPHQNKTTHFIVWEQPNCSGWTEISKYNVTMECGCDTTLGVCTWEETLSSMSTNASFQDLPTGPCRVSVTAVNHCEEETFAKLNFSIEPNSGDIIHKTWMWMILLAFLALAVHQLWL